MKKYCLVNLVRISIPHWIGYNGRPTNAANTAAFSSTYDRFLGASVANLLNEFILNKYNIIKSIKSLFGQLD